jgi:hypothetical protein
LSKPAASKAWVSGVWICAFCAVPVLAIIAVTLLAFSPARHSKAAGQVSAAHVTSQPATATPAARGRIQANYASLPLAFEANQGQTDSQVKYMARGNGYTLFLTANDAVFSLQSRSAESATSAVRRGAVQQKKNSAPRHTQQDTQKDLTAVVRMQLIGGNSLAQVSASGQLPGKSNYFLGNDPSKWHADVPHFARVSYQDVYPGVNLAYHGAQRQTEFDFIVAPGANPAPIGFHFTGAQGIKTDDSGNLVISSAAGDVELHKPVAYQEQNGARKLVDARFILKANNQVSFELGNYDRSRELVIDPSVSYAYSTYLGGSGNDEGQSIAFDSSGNAYVTGETTSADFPGFSSTNKLKGTMNAFVTKIAPDGSSLIYSTYVGGNKSDSGNSIAVNASGDAFVAGGTTSTTFPVMPAGAFQTRLNGTTNAFVFELGSSGTLTYSTYLGGTGADVALGIALASGSSLGDVYVVGKTTSSDFPILGALQGSLGSGNIASGFVTKLNSSGTAVVYSTYLGGSSVGDLAGAVAVDSSDNAYVTGQTFSLTFPTKNALQSACGSCTGGNSNAFVTVINPLGSAYVYSTFLGGSGVDAGDGIAVDSTGAYVTGATTSSNFPLQSALQLTYGGGTDAFVTKFNPAGSALLYSTYLGGSGFDVGASIAVDGSNNAYVTGQTNSANFKTVNPTQAALGGGNDAFVSEINSAGSALIFSTYLGGSADEDDGGNYGAIAVDSAGANIYVTGNTASTSTDAPPFPTDNAVQATNGGGTDAFVVKYTQGTTPTFSLTATALSPASVVQGSTATSTVTVTPVNGFTGNVALSCAVSGPSGATSPPTCGFVPATVTGGSGPSALTVSTTATTTAGAYTISVIGTGPSTMQSTPLSLTVTAVPPTFSLTATALSPASVSPGGTATSMVTVTGAGGFTGTVTLACTITGPSGPYPPTCSGTAVPGTPGTLTVKTTAATALLQHPANSRSSGVFYAMFLPIGGMALLGFGSAGSRRKKLFGLLLLGLLLSGVLLMPACGGSSYGGGGGGNPGTTAGTYSITVTGTASGATQTGSVPPLMLTVN